MIAFPILLPSNRPIKASGILSNPSVTCSLCLILPYNDKNKKTMTKTRRPCPTSITRDLEADPSNPTTSSQSIIIKRKIQSKVLLTKQLLYCLLIT